MVTLYIRGWVCERCDIVISPHERVCPRCSAPKPPQDTEIRIEDLDRLNRYVNYEED